MVNQKGFQHLFVAKKTKKTSTRATEPQESIHTRHTIKKGRRKHLKPTKKNQYMTRGQELKIEDSKHAQK